MKHIFKYLVGTKDYDIHFGPNPPLGLVGYTYLDYAGYLNCRKSMSGYLFQFEYGEFSCKSKLQDCVTTSTIEVEHIDVFNIGQEAVCLRRLACMFR
jgi:hypothetical protein